MSKASDLIERMERETGQRIDDNDGDNLAVAGLLGALARMLGKTPSTYKESDDVAAGLLIKQRMSPEYKQKKETDDLMASLLASGLSPDDVKDLLG